MGELQSPVSASQTRCARCRRRCFWQHEGVDFEQLQESLETDWARGRFVRGGSTITQQLAKNLYLSPSKNPMRKFQEFIIARRLEAEFEKVANLRDLSQRDRMG
jgi:membrane carboxypeptidase/penicillin-binding protein